MTSPRSDAIIMAAKRVFLKRGFQLATMDEIAEVAATTKPTVYAHFGSKERLFAAVIEGASEHFLEKLKTPSAYSAIPLEAVTCFCARFLELLIWTDAVALQRLVEAEMPRFPELAEKLYSRVFNSAIGTLMSYLDGFTGTASNDLPAYDLAELLIHTTMGPRRLRVLFGIEPPIQGPPQASLSPAIDLDPIRLTVIKLCPSLNASA